MRQVVPAGPKRLLFLMTGVMEMSWIYGWAVFSGLMLIQRPLPVTGGLVAMALAFFLTRISVGRGWRVIWIVLLQCAGFACASLVMLHGGFFGSHPLLDGKWAALLFRETKDAFTYFSIVIHLLWSALLWWAGLGLARRPLSYISVCRRFDAGLAAFFVLFLFKLILAVKGTATPASSVDMSLAAIFLICGLCAIGFAGRESGAKKTYLAGGKHRGIFIAFACAVVVIAGCLASLFLSQGQLFSEVGRKVFYGAGNFIGPIFVNVVRFFLMPNRMRREPASGGKSPSGPDILGAAGEGGWMGAVGPVLVWVITVLCILALLFAFSCCMLFLFRRLAAKGSLQKRPEGGIIKDLLDLLSRWRRAFLDLIRRARGKRRIHNAGYLYAALLRWGRCSGMEHSVWETPSEFGARLKMAFPGLAVEIDALVEGLNREVYGEIILGRGQFGMLRSSLRRMGSPRWWPLRIRSFFTGR